MSFVFTIYGDGIAVFDRIAENIDDTSPSLSYHSHSQRFQHSPQGVARQLKQN